MGSANDIFSELILAIRDDICHGLLYTHTRISDNTKKTFESASFLYALIELLGEKGIISIEELDGPQGVDFDIYVRKGAEPTATEYDYRGYTGSADEKIRIKPAESGEYYVMVRSYRGAGDFTLRAMLE